MIVRQEESTPIGDFFHDSGLWTVFNALSGTVDDFEVDTDQLNSWIDNLTSTLKSLKNQIKKIENEEQKKIHQREINDMINRGAE